MGTAVTYDSYPQEALDDALCLTCGHRIDDHLLLDEDEYGAEIKAAWDGRCLVEGCDCTNFR